MKYCLLGLLLLAQNLYSLVVLPSDMDIEGLKPLSISFDKKTHSKTPVRFTSITVQDLRNDSVTTGYVKFGQEYRQYFRLQLEGGVRSASAFLNSYFRTRAGEDSLRLTIQLKNFFIT